MTDTAPRWLQPMALDDLHGAPRNAKAHASDRIATSIGRFGFIEPIVLDERTGRLVAGHGRLDDLRGRRERGEEPPEGVSADWRVPVLRGWRSRSDAEAEAAGIALNRVGEAGGWETDVLSAMLAELAALDPALAEATGWTADELDALLAEVGGEPADGGEERPRVGAAVGSLLARFGVPPFTVLDARQGYWQDRRRRWTSLGIASQEGRGEDLNYDSEIGLKTGKFYRNDALTLGSLSGRVPGYYLQKRAAEARLGRPLDHAEFQADHLVLPDNAASLSASGTSLFDPVLGELLYRWFCPPRGRVLDPFAGGSVRGVVAAFMGRAYTGVDLSPHQVAANIRQWEAIVPAEGSAPDSTPAVTPVEEHGGLLVKRDDSWSRGGASGAKSRVMFALAEEERSAGILTAGARRSPQIERAALVARALGVPCRVHVPDGAPTPETETAAAAGAEVVRHKAGRLSVLRARLRDDAAAHPDWLHVPFGMGLDAYASDVARETSNIPDGVRRIVVPCGSGMTAAGILRGVGPAGPPLVCVTLGHDPAEYLDRFAPAGWRDRTTLIPAQLPFEEPAPETSLGDLRLDPFYEAKCLPFLRPGDLLWCVGIRGGGAPPIEAWEEPRWIVGDSTDVLDDDLGDPFDFVLSCPPYHDLEHYSEDPADLSNMPYEEFLAAYRTIIAKACRRLLPDRFAAFVVGDVRGPEGSYRNFVGDTIDAFRDAGLAFYNEAILVTPVGSLPVRVGRQFLVGRKLGKSHQNVLVFVKGDPSRASAACPLSEEELADSLALVSDGDLDERATTPENPSLS